MIKILNELRSKASSIRYFKNTLWMFFEQGVRFFSLILVGIYIARYLGPEKFGLLSYAIAIVAIFMSISRLGMESILVRELIIYSEERKEYLGTAHCLMFIASIISVALISSIISLFENDSQTKLYIFIISIGMIFQTFLVIDYSFQSQVKAKYSSIAKSIALSLGALIKIYLVYIQADLILFVFSYALDQVLIFLFLVVIYVGKKQPNFLFVFNINIAKQLLKSIWPMVLSSLAIILYMRIDQVMIKNMLDSEQLGLYAAITRIYEAWVMVSVILCTSLLPAIVKSKGLLQKKYENRLSLLFSLVFWLSIAIAAITTLFSESIIRISFGVEYVQASLVFTIIMWSAVFAALGSVTFRYLIAESMEKKITIRTLVALVINILLNLVLIPVYGIEGAAVSTLICLLVANYVIDYFDKELQILVKIKNRAIFHSFYLIKKNIA